MQNSTLLEALRTHAERSPDGLAHAFFADGGVVSESLSYGDLARKSHEIAAFLRAETSEGDRVLLLFEPGLAFLTAFFGCLISGRLAVPAYPPRRNKNQKRLEAIASDCAPTIALMSDWGHGRANQYLRDDSFLGGLRTQDVARIVADPIDRADEGRPRRQDIAFLQYTSGSTATAKGVMVSHRNLMANLEELRASLGHTESSVMVSWLPLFHDMGLIHGVLVPLYVGFPCYLMSPSEFVSRPVNWLRAITRFRGTHSASPNFGYEHCLNAIADEDLDGLDLSTWACAPNAAEPIRFRTMQRFSERFGRVGFHDRAFSPCYGLAEATLKVSALGCSQESRWLSVCTRRLERGEVVEVGPNDPTARRVVGCGTTNNQAEVRIVDPDSRRLRGEDAVGEIWVSGPSVAEGYWNRPDATAETFHGRIVGEQGGPYLRTGDLGFVRGGQLFVTGRIKELIIIRGQNFYPQDIEDTVQDCNPLLITGRGAAFGVEEDGAERLVVVQEVQRPANGHDWDRLCADILSAVALDHDVPCDAIVLIRTGTLPRSSSGKIERYTAHDDYLHGRLKIVFAWRRPVTAPAGPARPVAMVPSGDAVSWLTAQVGQLLDIDPGQIRDDEPLSRYGADSVRLIQLATRVAEHFGRPFDPIEFFEYPTLGELARHLTVAPTIRSGSEPAVLRQAAGLIAVIGMACRFPGADDCESFWDHQVAGTDEIRNLPAGRRLLHQPAEVPSGEAVPGQAGYLDQVDQFDPAPFRLSPSEADLMDPQQRLLLEVAWEAIESVGPCDGNWEGQQVGVFVGISNSDYLRLAQAGAGDDAHVATGNAHCMAANRLSYIFDWSGPSLAVDTACSSSLVALHEACASLNRGECRVALAGGVNLILDERLTASFHRAGMLSASCRCRTFDERADGYVRGEGCGAVVLKPYSAALRDGDRILALILGSAVNQDGRTNGITAPNGRRQEDVIRSALQAAGVAPEIVSYVEAHGTGTVLGDPIEVKALQSVLGTGRRTVPCAVGSVKANIGHLEAAAGIAGLIKTVLALQHQQIPANRHLESLSSRIVPFAKPLSFPRESVAWQPVGGRRIAGVSSFGFGGANAHVILEGVAAPPEPARVDEAPAHLLCLSAQTDAALRDVVHRWAGLIRGDSTASAGAIAWNSQVARYPLRHRFALTADSREEFLAGMERYLAGNASGARTGCIQSGTAPRVAFVFPSPGKPGDDWRRELGGPFPVYREAAEECVSVAERAGLSPPTDFVRQYALARLWESWSIRPVALLGDGAGEFVAAVIAGAVSLEDGFRLVTQWGPSASEGLHHRGGESVQRDPGPLPGADVCRKPVIPLVSRTSGQFLSEAPTVEHWRDCLSQPLLADPSPLEFLAGQVDVLLVIGADARLAGAPVGASGRWGELAVLSSWPSDPAGEGGRIHPILECLGALFVQGAQIDWEAVHAGKTYRRLTLPSYPFQRQSCWFRRVETVASPSVRMTNPVADRAATRRTAPDPGGTPRQDEERRGRIPVDEARWRLAEISARLMRMPPDQIDPQQSFLELGADSIVMVSALRVIESQFGIRISIKQLFNELPNLDALARYIAETPAVDRAAPPDRAASTPETAAVDLSPDLPEELRELIRRQDETLRSLVEQQRELHVRLSAEVGGTPGSTMIPAHARRDDPAAPQTSSLPPWRPAPAGPDGLKQQQQRHVEVLTKRYNARTGRSKSWADQSRRHLADNRASAGFRFSTKEMLYPLVGQKAWGARVEDIDGNAYLDLTMGFGVYLFGHAPEFVRSAIEEELQRGYTLGPQCRHAGEVAELLCALTGHDRAAFCNSGTEAVMTALRLARTVTGRDRIVLFEGSYHGHFDGVLAAAERSIDRIRSRPVAGGISPTAVRDVLPLAYGDDQSLEIIRAEGHRLAAVLVEPVQSRRPDLQPRAFLHELREITRRTGTALIFDEMITGFRIEPGGAQAHFGVRADLATYGKIVGGGMPIGVVAGRAEFLDALDGGAWTFGDASFPGTETTFFAGTFNKHPLTMAAALAVLRRIRDGGAAPYRELNERTERLTSRLNDIFTREAVPVRVARFGSLFRFVHETNQDIFIYNLLDRGIFIWEGRNCFLSTAHGDADVDLVCHAVQDSVDEMRRARFWAPPGGTEAVSGRPVRTPGPLVSPLSKAQKQLRLLARLSEGGSAAYHESVVLRFGTGLDEQALRQAILGLAARHEAIRTVIELDRDEQRVVPEVALPLEVVEAGPGQSSDELLTPIVSRPFDWGRGCLFRVVLIRGATGGSDLVLCGHHAVIDGWSIRLLVEDLGRLYTRATQGHPVLPEAAPSFTAYLERQEAYRASQDHGASLRFWLDRLGRGIPALELPSERPRPAIQTFRSRVVDDVLTPEMVVKLQRFSAENRATFFMTVLAGYLLWLHRTSGQSELIVGIPTLGRDDQEDAGLVGFCANMLPVRSRYRPDRTLGEFATSVRQELLDVYEHQRVPLADLLEHLELPYDPSRTPLFTATFNLDQAPTLDGLFPSEVEVGFPVPAFSKYECAVNLTLVGQECRVRLEYASDLWDEPAARRMLDQYLTVLGAMTADPAAPLDSIGLLTTDERRRWLIDRNQTRRPGPAFRDLVEGFRQQVARSSTRTAVEFQGRSLTYGDLDARSDELASRLSGLGVRPETPVGICLSAGLDLPVAVLGTLKAGGSYVPMDPLYPRRRLESIAQDVRCRLIVTSSPHREMWAGAAAQVLCLDEPWPRPLDGGPSPRTLATPPIDPDQLAYTIHTSGSTGEPKGVSVSHGAVVNFLASMAREPGIREGDRLLAVTTFSFDIAGLELFLPLLYGGTVVYVDDETRRNGQLLRRMIVESGATIMQATPVTWRLLLKAGWDEGRALTILCGGEAMDPELARQLLERGASAWNLYGPTETTIWSSLRRIRTPAQPIDLGMPIDNTCLYVVDGDLHPTPPGVPGELLIGGAGIARGYFGKTDRTAERFIPDPFSGRPGGRLYRTGDLVRFRDDGLLEFLGRLDHQVKINGFRIELEEVRQVLAGHRDISDAVVIASRIEPTGGQALTACLIPAGKRRPTRTELVETLAAQLPLHMIPARFRFFERFPLTPNGKIDRRALDRAEAEDADLPTAHAGPRDDVERRLQTIWQAVLGRDRVGAHDNFFDLGGNSLALAEVHARAEQDLDRKFPLLDTIRFPTIRLLAAHLAEGESRPSDGLLARARRRGRLVRQALEHQSAP
jgi:amino acid adenylation domain-containing protein